MKEVQYYLKEVGIHSFASYNNLQSQAVEFRI